MACKRKHRDFSAHEKLVHKSCLLLQREAKKLRTFMLRKVLQQLKQLKQQLLAPVTDEVKNEKREHNLRRRIERLEREHLGLKSLNLTKLVTKARLQTGLDRPENEQEATDDVEREPVKAIETQEIGNLTTTDPTKEIGEIEEKLMNRLLAHKQLVPLLDAIRTLVEKEEKEAEKKRRLQEKRALKRSRHESLIGNTGRSGIAPTSLFLGSLSGRDEFEEVLETKMDTYGTMAEADDEIAEFLGEKKSKKNRAGQTARRMKAMRQEEALKRQEKRQNGHFVAYKEVASDGKYGLSERPKKAKAKVKRMTESKPFSRVAMSSAATTTAQPSIAPVTTAPHPSWLAKQKQKEKEKATLFAYSGTKITF